ncbi:hypothetical protein GLAREA_07449 [Glarea lozoyensis ATCC 20868]|uniref:Uncharacterized protein n=1 Tax=Glarea lozoyensis (strain ATCC 20868 / MF5171) TaxID=1116229 RepID=S3DJV4_GLAL2|nr:uncharacterized protein GLAREA_07449 [Glarea lozoyensis ATCC 20868]EPE32316.1 hypothetical protein GLAREA_07449 [Glarea lozoyensis ATCC 20868]
MYSFKSIAHLAATALGLLAIVHGAEVQSTVTTIDPEICHSTMKNHRWVVTDVVMDREKDNIGVLFNMYDTAPNPQGFANSCYVKPFAIDNDIDEDADPWKDCLIAAPPRPNESFQYSIDRRQWFEDDAGWIEGVIYFKHAWGACYWDEGRGIEETECADQGAQIFNITIDLRDGEERHVVGYPPMILHRAQTQAICISDCVDAGLVANETCLTTPVGGGGDDDENEQEEEEDEDKLNSKICTFQN